jgi:hypothetical protein
MTNRSLVNGAILGGVLLVGGWLLGGAPGGPQATSAVAPRRAPRAPGRSPIGNPPGALVSRNIFEFADDAVDVPASEGARDPRPLPTPLALPRAETPPQAPEPVVRLVGVVLRSGQRKAALSIRGELSVLGLGESTDGYTVLAIDEEDGVRLKGPEGEVTLAPPHGPAGN